MYAECVVGNTRDCGGKVYDYVNNQWGTAFVRLVVIDSLSSALGFVRRRAWRFYYTNM